MKRLYLDCDGVLLNTIETTYQMMQEKGLDIKDKELVHQVFVDMDWEYLIKKAGVLDNSIEKVKYLLSLKKYYISILTTCVNNLEPEIKRKYFADVLPEVDVITVPWLVRKDSVVMAHDAILVDDSTRNIHDWRSAGGIGIHFVQDKTNDDYFKINDLLQVPEVLKQKIKRK